MPGFRESNNPPEFHLTFAQFSAIAELVAELSATNGTEEGEDPTAGVTLSQPMGSALFSRCVAVEARSWGAHAPKAVRAVYNAHGKTVASGTDE